MFTNDIVSFEQLGPQEHLCKSKFQTGFSLTPWTKSPTNKIQYSHIIPARQLHLKPITVSITGEKSSFFKEQNQQFILRFFHHQILPTR